MYYENELYHHGVKGMKWGIRKLAKDTVQGRISTNLKGRKNLNGYQIENGDYLCHKSHKYIDKKWSHGRWNYIYEEGQKKRANYNLNIPDTAHPQHIQTNSYNVYDTGAQYALVPATHDPNKDKLKEAMNNAHGHAVHKETNDSQKEQVTHGPHGVENVGSNTKEHEPKKEQSTFDKIKETGHRLVYHLIQKLTGEPNSMSTYVKEHMKDSYPYVRYWLDYNGTLYNPHATKKSK